MARPITAVYLCLVILAHSVKGDSSTTLNITGNRSNISKVVQWTGGVGGTVPKFNTTQILNRIVNQDLAGGIHNSTYNNQSFRHTVAFHMMKALLASHRGIGGGNVTLAPANHQILFSSPAVNHHEPTGYIEGDELFEWITEGVMLTTISGFGLFGNALSIYVLLRPSVRGTFSNILTGLATFDALFLILAIVTFGLPIIAGDVYRKILYPPITPICYGLVHTFRVGSAFATLSVTVERFFAIVFPLRDFRCIKKWLLPATAIFTIIYNIPKFFEVTTVVDPSTNDTVVAPTSIRQNEIYVSVYVVWSKLILTELVPYFTILILNSFIVVKIVKSARFRRKVIRNHEGGGKEGKGHEGAGGDKRGSQSSHKKKTKTLTLKTDGRNVPHLRVEESTLEERRIPTTYDSKGGSTLGQQVLDPNPLSITQPAANEYKRNYFDKQRQEHRLGILLVGISVLFISCQSFKIIPDVYEVIYCEEPSSGCDTTPFISTCISLSHLLVCFNSAANCIMYLLIGEKFRKIFCDTFCRGKAGCLKGSGSSGSPGIGKNGDDGTNGIPLQTWTFRTRRQRSGSSGNTSFGRQLSLTTNTYLGTGYQMNHQQANIRRQSGMTPDGCLTTSDLIQKRQTQSDLNLADSNAAAVSKPLLP